jgi:hypothetical protein
MRRGRFLDLGKPKINILRLFDRKAMKRRVQNIFDRWGISLDELAEITESRPSLRGVLLGYVGECKLRKMLLSDDRISNIISVDNHDRSQKGDMIVTYKGVPISIQMKSLQTASVRRTDRGYIGRFQCDASDRRKVVLPNVEKLETTYLLVGGFDLLAVNLFEFGQEWRFAFAKNEDLPRSTFKGYTPEQRQYLLATLSIIRGDRREKEF